MVIIKFNKLFNNIIIKTFIIFICIQNILTISEYFQSFRYGAISSNASLIDISDYNDIYPIITTDNQIYIGMTPNRINVENSSIINISAAATYDNNTILLACSENYLLSKINIYTGEEISLLSYNKFNLSIESLNYSCSICYSNNIAYVGIIQIINTTLEKNVIKIELEDQYNNNGTLVKNQIIYSFDYLLPITENNNFTRQISCEIITPNNSLSDEVLVCGYIKYDNLTLKYSYIASLLNSQFNEIHSITILTTQSLFSFRLQKINSTYIRYLTTKYSYEIYIEKESEFKLKYSSSSLRNKYLYSFDSFNDIF